MKYAPFALVLVVLAVGTVIEGQMSERWGQSTSAKLEAFTARLKDVPMKVGDWQGVDQPYSQEEFEASNCSGCISRTYTNRDGQQVNVYLVAGSARHVTIHTPDWCYVGAGYDKMDDPQQYTIDVKNLPSHPEFMTAPFRKEEMLSTHHIRIFWAFSEDGNWRGPSMPKPTYAGLPALYKIYMITEIDGSSDIESNPTLEFAREFLPQVNRVLFPVEENTEAPAA